MQSIYTFGKIYKYKTKRTFECAIALGNFLNLFEIRDCEWNLRICEKK